MRHFGGNANGAPLPEEELRSYCERHVASYKVPRRIIFVDDFPSVNGPNGVKILKNRLREAAEAYVPEGARA